SNFRNDRRHYALVDILFPNKMNALFTRNIGVFRAFLFFPNCKTREKETDHESFQKQIMIRYFICGK
ncbi:MAG TPA: hypothetical protein PKV59_03790, partial [Flexilinea sp.]|nr:hypothetical protein [Flexilinea sp.]HQP45906.1 hypothetical protein [Flexilinea sp.]